MLTIRPLRRALRGPGGANIIHNASVLVCEGTQGHAIDNPDEIQTCSSATKRTRIYTPTSNFESATGKMAECFGIEGLGGGGGAGVCLKGRALWGQTHSSYEAVGARCTIGCGGSHWRLETRVGGIGAADVPSGRVEGRALGGGGTPPPFKQSPRAGLPPADPPPSIERAPNLRPM